MRFRLATTAVFAIAITISPSCLATTTPNLPRELITHQIAPFLTTPSLARLQESSHTISASLREITAFVRARNIYKTLFGAATWRSKFASLPPTKESVDAILGDIRAAYVLGFSDSDGAQIQPRDMLNATIIQSIEGHTTLLAGALRALYCEGNVEPRTALVDHKFFAENVDELAVYYNPMADPRPFFVPRFDEADAGVLMQCAAGFGPTRRRRIAESDASGQARGTAVYALFLSWNGAKEFFSQDHHGVALLSLVRYFARRDRAVVEDTARRLLQVFGQQHTWLVYQELWRDFDRVFGML